MRKHLVWILGALASLAMLVSTVYFVRLPPIEPSLEGIDFEAQRAEAGARRAEAENAYREAIDRIDASKHSAERQKQRGLVKQ